jgi:hypothetical protein
VVVAARPDPLSTLDAAVMDAPNPSLYPLQLQVTAPWKSLLEQADRVRVHLDPLTWDPTKSARHRPNAASGEGHSGAHLDRLVVRALPRYLPAVWQIVSG